MKVGDYVRIDTGIIEKLEGIHEQNETNETIIKLNKMGGGRYAHILDINSEFAKEFDKTFSRGNIIKSSPNIIDLIEVGDYVNGSYIYSIVEENKNTGQPRVLFTEEDGVLGSGEIKSIVTKEAFEQMEYRIGE